MSYTSATLASGGTAYFDGSFTTPVEVALPRIEYPYPDDTSTRQITRRYWVRSGSYVASSIAPNTTDATFTLAVLTEERIVGDPGADLYEIERIYNEVPSPRQDYETYVYTYPGSNQSLFTGNSTVTLTGASYCTTTRELTWSSPTFAPGQKIRVFPTISAATFATASGTLLVASTYVPASPLNTVGASGDAISYSSSLFTNRSFSVTGLRAITVTASITRRNPVQINALTRIETDFWLLGNGSLASFSSPDQIGIAQQFQVVNAFTGEPQDYLQPNTSPSVAEYVELMAEGAEIVAAETLLQQWRGNIYQRSTRYVKAR
jgi:hypothetical protein